MGSKRVIIEDELKEDSSLEDIVHEDRRKNNNENIPKDDKRGKNRRLRTF